MFEKVRFRGNADIFNAVSQRLSERNADFARSAGLAIAAVYLVAPGSDSR
jgi:hypothetical protein